MNAVGVPGWSVVSRKAGDVYAREEVSSVGRRVSCRPDARTVRMFVGRYGCGVSFNIRITGRHDTRHSHGLKKSIE